MTRKVQAGLDDHDGNGFDGLEFLQGELSLRLQRIDGL
jgi:hypothetical protein